MNNEQTRDAGNKPQIVVALSSAMVGRLKSHDQQVAALRDQPPARQLNFKNSDD